MKKLFSSGSIGIDLGLSPDSGTDLVDLDIPRSSIAVQNPRSIRLLVICGVLLIGMIAIGAALMIDQFRQRALTNSERELANTALLLARHLDQELEELELAQEKLIEHVRAVGIDSPEDFEREMSSRDAHLMLRAKIEALPHVGRFSLIGSDGKLINSSHSWPIPAVNVADREYFNALKSDPQSTTFLSEPLRSRLTDTSTVILARKLTGSSGQFLGLVLGGVELALFEQFFESVALGKGASIAMFNRDGTLLARHPRIDSMIGRNFKTGPLFRQDHGTARLVGRIDGQERLISAHSLKRLPIMVMASTTLLAALADWRQQTTFLIGVAGLSVLVITVILFLIVRQLSREHELSEQRLMLEKQRLDTAVNNMMEGLVLLDASERIVVVNQRYIEMYRLSPEVAKPGCSFRDLMAHRKETGTFAGDVDEFCFSILRNIAQRKSTRAIVETVDGRSIQIANRPLANGGWVSTHDDITERQRINAELRQKNEQFDAALKNMTYGLSMFDTNQRLVIVNDRYREIYGLTREQVEPGLPTQQVVELCIANGFIPGVDPQQYVRERLGSSQVDSTGTYQFKDGRLVTISRRRMPGGGWLATHEDVTERRRIEARVAHLAHHDALTDLPNRVLMREQLERTLSDAHLDDMGLAVLCLDLDRFKEVNDTLGHAVGDELLKAVATRLRTCVRENELVARLGGDEFTVVITAADPTKEAALLATRLIQSLTAPHCIEGHQLAVGTSIGIAVFPSDGNSAEQLLKNADLALYDAKGDGRGIYRFFEPEMKTCMQARRALEMDLRKALEHGQLTLHYQPLLNLATDQICACEALLRWNHPERGRVLPGEFIPAAEATGLIVPIGEWALREACREAASWPAEIKVAVNLSALQLKSLNLVRTVVGALAASGLSSDRLELEITESVLLGNNKMTLEVLEQLRNLGVRIALDDFGTGYSSLSYLHSFPFDKIKVDRCFVGSVANKGQNALAILRTITQLGRSLGMDTTAEGVETQEQLELVRTEGCTEMQGYLFSPPIAADAFREFLSQRCERCASAA